MRAGFKERRCRRADAQSHFERVALYVSRNSVRCDRIAAGGRVSPTGRRVCEHHMAQDARAISPAPLSARKNSQMACCREARKHTRPSRMRHRARRSRTPSRRGRSFSGSDHLPAGSRIGANEFDPRSNWSHSSPTVDFPDRGLTTRVLPEDVGMSVAVEVAGSNSFPIRPRIGPNQ